MYDIASIYSARSVDDAIRALQADPAAVVIAGGTDKIIWHWRKGGRLYLPLRSA